MIREGVESDLNLVGLTILVLLAGEFEGLFAEFDPSQADQAGGRRLWVGEDFEGPKRDHLRRFLGQGFRSFANGRSGFLGEAHAPLEGVGAVEPPDGRAGAGNAPVAAHPGALFPAVANAWRWIVEKDHELVEVGLIFRSRRVLKPVQEGIQPGNGEGWRLGARLFHGCDFNASGKQAVALHSLRSFESLKRCVPPFSCIFMRQCGLLSYFPLHACSRNRIG